MNCSPLPVFSSQPDEESVFQPAIIEWMNAAGIDVHTGGIWDLFVPSTGILSERHLELKVCLSTQREAFPITRQQWNRFDTVADGSSLALRTRFLVYRQTTKLYSLLSFPDVRAILTSGRPQSTSYAKHGFLATADWLDPTQMAAVLYAWIHSPEVPPLGAAASAIKSFLIRYFAPSRNPRTADPVPVKLASAEISKATGLSAQETRAGLREMKGAGLVELLWDKSQEAPEVDVWVSPMPALHQAS